MLLEKIKPTVDDLTRFISGKTIDARLGAQDIRSVEEFADILWMRVFENDLIPSDRRQEILDQMFPFETQSHAGEVRISQAKSSRPEGLTIPLMVVAAAALGTLVAVIIGLEHEPLNVTQVLGVFVGIVATLLLPALILGYRIQLDPRPGRRREARRLTTFPNEDEGKQALDILDRVAPLAVCALYGFAQDEVRCLRTGLPRGLALRHPDRPWNKELIDRGLIEQSATPGIFSARAGWFVLSNDGKSVARLLVSNEAPPGWLLRVYDGSSGIDERLDEVSRNGHSD